MIVDSLGYRIYRMLCIELTVPNLSYKIFATLPFMWGESLIKQFQSNHKLINKFRMNSSKKH